MNPSTSNINLLLLWLFLLLQLFQPMHTQPPDSSGNDTSTSVLAPSLLMPYISSTHAVEPSTSTQPPVESSSTTTTLDSTPSVTTLILATSYSSSSSSFSPSFSSSSLFSSTSTVVAISTSSVATETEIMSTPKPTDTTTEDSPTNSPLLSLPVIVGLAAGGVTFLLLFLLCLFCCWYCFCRVNHKYEYKMGMEMRVTARYWTEGSAHYTVTKENSLSSRASSLRSSLGLRPKVQKNHHSSDDHIVYENQSAPHLYSTPL